VTLSELQSAQAALRMAQIDTQRVRFESDAQKEISRLRYRIAEIDFKRTQNKIKHSKIIKAEELKIQKQKIERLKREIDKAENAIERYSIYAPSKGMIEYQLNRRNRQKIRVGDNIGIGDGIVGLPDLSQMKAVTSVNEKDIDKIKIGQKVLVKLDAFPKKIFEASVIKISRMCKPKENKSKIKVFDVEVLLEKSDPILRPGMTVSCEIIIADFENALFVDHNCVHQDENGYFVLIDNGSEPQKVVVTLGPKNSKMVVINGDVKAGDRIISYQNTGNV
jgi:RND family efflux transporter MFP subunit